MRGNPERLWEAGPLFYQAENIRLTTDAVLLADFARVEGKIRGTDLGCASGALMLLLLWRVPELSMTGLELSLDAAVLAEENMRINGLKERSDIICGDFRKTVKTMEAGSYDLVISNPPYYEPARGDTSPNSGRATARAELACSLGDICAAASRLCRSGGKVFFSYRPDGMNRLLLEMTQVRLEPKRLRFVHHRLEKNAGLVLVEGRKDGNPGLTVEVPLVLSTAEGQETDEYRRIYHREKTGYET